MEAVYSVRIDMLFIDSDDNKYYVRVATINDIPDDMHNAAVMLDKVDDQISDYVEYENKMKIAVNECIAVCVYKNDKKVGALYIYSIDGIKAYGACMYSNEGILPMFAMVAFVRAENISVSKLYMVPHGNNIKYFISTAEASSIRAYHSKITPYITINFAKLATKINAITEKYGFKQCQL